MAITRSTMLSRNPEIGYTALDAEGAVMLVAGECYALNLVAMRIWQLLEQPMTVANLCMRICEEFEVDVETCEKAVLNFAVDIVNDRIVCARETAPTI